MKLDLTSFAFGYKIADSAGNPNWATALGQGSEYKINDDIAIDPVLKGLVYTSIPLSIAQTKIGKGGKLYKCDDPQAAVVLASLFRTVYVNEQKVADCGFLILLTRDTSKSHEGRLRLKYGPHNAVIDQFGNIVLSNAQELGKIRSALGLSATACWFVYAFDIVNQDELHLFAGIAGAEGPVSYTTTEDLHKKWNALIPADGGDSQAQQKGGCAEASFDSDKLTLAIKEFQKSRGTEEFDGWESCDAWAKACREVFTTVDAGKFIEEGFDYAGFMRKFLYSATVANTYFKDHTPEEKTIVGNFIAQNRNAPQSISWYLDSANKPNATGMGVGVMLNFMMKVRPAEFVTYSPMMDDMLVFTGLAKSAFPKEITVESYEANKALQGQVIAKMKELGIGKAADDDSAADYLTVNEFAWWLSEEKNRNLIDKKILEGMKMKTAEHKEIPAQEKTNKPKVNMSDADDVLLLRLRAALRTKPFAILAGHSGTGKSRMVRKLAYLTCGDGDLRVDEKGNELKEPGNFCMVQVKPNWHDSSDLLGYYSELGKRYRATEFVKFICKAYAYPKVPFFVCLDEMNLAPVEQYFAEYLSAIESRKIDGDGILTDELVPKMAYSVGEGDEKVVHYDWLGCEFDKAKDHILKDGLTIPRNLFVVGTVNMDESTNQFSRKVLDRAMTIEMTDADFNAFGTKGTELKFSDYMGDAAVADLLSGEVQATKLETDQTQNLNALKEVLKSTSFAVAYRFANEYALYEAALKATLDTEKNQIEKVPDGADTTKLPAQPVAFDDMVLMKVLPRISGDDTEVKRLFYGKDGSAKEPKENTLLKLLGADKDTGSVRKIKSILARGGSYLSFWP